jgi:hypothetical protein
MFAFPGGPDLLMNVAGPSVLGSPSPLGFPLWVLICLLVVCLDPRIIVSLTAGPLMELRTLGIAAVRSVCQYLVALGFLKLLAPEAFDDSLGYWLAAFWCFNVFYSWHRGQISPFGSVAVGLVTLGILLLPVLAGWRFEEEWLRRNTAKGPMGNQGGRLLTRVERADQGELRLFRIQTEDGLSFTVPHASAAGDRLAWLSYWPWISASRRNVIEVYGSQGHAHYGGGVPVDSARFPFK